METLNIQNRLNSTFNFNFSSNAELNAKDFLDSDPKNIDSKIENLLFKSNLDKETPWKIFIKVNFSKKEYYFLTFDGII